ncbi:Serine/threonine-protein kinase/endoribonuclease ire-1 [Triplophysa tibetana]|uniref:Serine/threonine-protein kinase/endoribonuclease ire-1 n=1 Tax=Triplophysa tibetana TaxID=1572043 RepID=A0A5A9PPR2_9TELE|nr:Serine/threonine-protein kinase/endoribonuclease ire-1 [Triplophysa tibetana]
MAYQIQLPLQVSIPVVPRKTDPLIQCIIDNKLQRLKKLTRGKDIDGLYPSEVWNDDVTLLTAAVICKSEEICSYLIKESADPNKHSTNRLAPLHYAGFRPGVPLSILKRLLAAKADPDGCDLQLSPLQFAVDHNRDDIVKALLEAGATPSRNYGGNPGLDKKMDDMIHQLSSQNEDFEKVQIFFSFSCAVQKKQQTEVFSIYRAHFLKENPFTHILLFEEYFSVIGAGAEQYQQSAIKWLKDTKSADKYIEDVIKRFPRISKMHYLAVAFNCLNAVLRVSERISPQIFNDLVPILTNSVQPFGNAQGDGVNQLILTVLDVMMQKNYKQKLNISHSVYETVCNALMPLTRANSIQISLSTYGVFAQVNDFAPEVVAKCGLSPVPEKILNAAEIKMDETMKEKLQKLNTSLEDPASFSAVDSVCEDNAVSHSTRKQKKKKKKKNQQELESMKGERQEPMTPIKETNSSVQPFTPPVENHPAERRWHPISRRWNEQFKKLSKMDVNKNYRIQSFTLVLSDEFRIAKGSDGTQVFLGLRDDGTEVAVKRMLKSNYQDLKNEETFLRLPELDSPSIVRYIDFAEDDNFGYLILQLCEYTLEEFIQDHLPADSSQRTCVLKRLAREVLCSLQVLHSQQTKVLHRDIKPQNVLIDIRGKARLADFGISRRLKPSETTLRTSTAGTKFWKAKEAIDEESNSGYKRCSDIQVAGMLVYYILSRGHHPFGKGAACEYNILQGKYTMEHLDDDVAKDLVEWMINEAPGKRPTVEQTLAHPFFWNDERKVDYVKKLGNQTEAENCRKVDEELLRAIEKCTEGKTFSEWRNKFSPELVQKLDEKKKAYPENTLGLLRFVRNLHEHYSEDAANINLMALFPDLFGSVYKFAKERGWHSRPTLKRFMNTAP